MTPRLLRAVVLTALVLPIAACGGSPPDSPTPDPGGTAVIDSPTTAAATTPPPAPAPTDAGGGGGGGGGGGPVEVLPASWKLCQNQLRGSSMGYPGDWFTTSLGPSDACSLFHPTSFTIPPNSEFPLVAMNAVQSQDSAATYLANLTDPMFNTTQLKEATTVAGRSATKFEVTSTGEGLNEVGTRRYGYIIDRGGKAFVLYTVAKASETRYNNWKFTVDTAKGTLRFL